MSKRTRRLINREALRPSEPDWSTPATVFWWWLSQQEASFSHKPRAEAFDLGVHLGIALTSRHPDLGGWFLTLRDGGNEALSAGEATSITAHMSDHLAELVRMYQTEDSPEVCAGCGGPVLHDCGEHH